MILYKKQERGIPKELDYAKHKLTPYRAEDFEDRVFEFKNKPNIRIYHRPPVRFSSRKYRWKMVILGISTYFRNAS